MSVLGQSVWTSFCVGSPTVRISSKLDRETIDRPANQPLRVRRELSFDPCNNIDAICGKRHKKQRNTMANTSPTSQSTATVERF